MNLEKSIDEQNQENPITVEEKDESLIKFEEEKPEEKLETDSIEIPLKK